MMNWWLIGILFIVGLFLFRAKELKHRFGLLIISVLLIFLAFSLYHVYSTHTVDLTTFDGVVSAGKTYVSWLSTIYHNTVKVTTYAIHQDWGINATTAS